MKIRSTLGRGGRRFVRGVADGTGRGGALCLGLRRLRFEALEDRCLLSGVTLITHGFHSNADSWVDAMADAVISRIEEQSGYASAEYQLEIDENIITADDITFTRESSWSYQTAPSGEAVIKIDWGDLAGDWFDDFLTSTTEVAEFITEYIFNSQSWVVSSPIHLIGHSRGASLIGALAEGFGQRGIWVDQTTYLDTCPLSLLGQDDWGDDGFIVTNNVWFADSYWREDGVNLLEWDDVDGQPVYGARDKQLDESVLGGAFSDPGYLEEHKDVHLWYHGTIDIDGDFSDGEKTIRETDGWYGGAHPSRTGSGYYYSRVVGGDRPDDGVHEAFGGTGARPPIDWADAVWPNVIDLHINTDDLQFAVGDSIPVAFYYQDCDSSATINFFLDEDRNPYNGNEQLANGKSIPQTDPMPVDDDHNIDTVGVPSDNYFVLGAITDDDGHVRYAYADGQITLTANDSPVADAGGPYWGDPGNNITLDASGSHDPDGWIVSYKWDLDNDGEYDDATGVTTTFNSTVLGLHTVRVLVTDNHGLTDTDASTVTITTGVPVPSYPGEFSPPGPTVPTVTPVFQWSAVPEADYYGLYVRDLGTGLFVFDSDVDDPVYGTSFPLPDGLLQDGGSYKWDTRAHSPVAGWSAFSDDMYFQVDLSDVVKPWFDTFSVNRSSAQLGQEFTISYTVSDSGGSGLNRVELWRAQDSGGSPGVWEEITRTNVSGNGPAIGSFGDTPPSAGDWWYGAHVVDNAGNWWVEPDPPGPIRVTVHPAPQPVLTLSITPNSFSEGAGTHAALGSVTRSGLTASALTVRIQSNDNTEATAEDPVVIPAGMDHQIFQVRAVNDSDIDGTQTAVLTASAPGYQSGTFQVQVTDDDQPLLSIGDVVLIEGDEGDTIFEFPVSLSAPRTEEVNFSFRTVDGTATGTATATGDDADYNTMHGSCRVMPFDWIWTDTISVSVHGDTAFEPDEVLYLEIYEVVNATAPDPIGQGTILNDDPRPTGGSVTGVKFEDRNANGERDPGEVGLQDWEIQLWRTGEANQPLQNFLNPTPENSDYFGYSVAGLGADRVLVGVPSDNTLGDDAGAAYLFDVSTGSLLHTFSNPTPAAYDWFGHSVVGVGAKVLVGGPNDDTAGPAAGAAYLFSFNGSTWDLEHTFYGKSGGDNFGYCVAAMGDKVLVGAPGAGTLGGGAAYLYTFNGSGWDELVIPNPDPAPLEWFGNTVAALGEDVLVNAPRDSTGAPYAGTAYLFDGSTGDLLQTFLNPTPDDNDNFGLHALAGFGDKVLVGCRSDQTTEVGAGAAYLFDGKTGELLHTLLSPAPAYSESFGFSVAVLGNLAVIGAFGHDTQSGVVYLFDASTGEHTRTLLNPTPADYDNFGYSVAAFDDHLVVGAIGDDMGALSAGIAYSFEGGYRLTTTDTTGTYSFFGVDPGDYRISEIAKEGWTQTYPPGNGTYTISIVDNEDLSGRDFGNLAIEVVARHVFYNGSYWDNPANDPSFDDDTAVAPEKEALLPDHVATSANYTSYSRGINGIMVDIAGLPDDYTPVPGDFEFHVGNDNDPAGWDEFTAPITVDVRQDVPAAGTDRVTIIWDDHDPNRSEETAVAGQWLQVTVLPTPHCPLPTADVFYFGNVVAEAGNSTTDAKVTTTDLLLARNNPRSLLDEIDVTFPYDFDRDGQVNATDVLLARNNQTSFLNALKLIDLGGEGEMGSEGSEASGEGEEVSAQALAWLGDAGVGRENPRQGRREVAAAVAVDMLLAMYWGGSG